MKTFLKFRFMFGFGFVFSVDLLNVVVLIKFYDVNDWKNFDNIPCFLSIYT